MSMSPVFILSFSTMSAIISMSLQRKHLLMSLLALEMMMLSLSVMIPISMHMNNSLDTSLILVILTFAACEATIGLASLVNLIRTKGNDLIKSFNTTKC